MKNSWEQVKLGNILKQNTITEELRPDKMYRLLGVRLEGKGPFVREEKLGSEIRTKRLRKVTSGEFIYSRLFAWRGAFGLISPELDGGFVSNEFPTFKIDENRVFPRFLEMYFKQKWVWEKVETYCSGTTKASRNRFKETFFINFEIQVPSLDEQKRIVARIENLMNNIEETRILNNKTLEEEDIIVRCERNKIFQIDQQITFESIVKDKLLGLDRSLSQQGPENPVPYIKMNNITIDGRLDLKEITYVDVTPEEMKKYCLQIGDFLFNTRNSYELVGKTAVWKERNVRAVFNNNIMRIRFKENIMPEFINEAFLTDNVKSQLRVSKKQTTNVCAVYWRDLRDLKIPLPTIVAQRRFVTYLNSLKAKVDELKKLQSETKKDIEELVPRILDKAFRGEL